MSESERDKKKTKDENPVLWLDAYVPEKDFRMNVQISLTPKLLLESSVFLACVQSQRSRISITCDETLTFRGFLKAIEYCWNNGAHSLPGLGVFGEYYIQEVRNMAYHLDLKLLAALAVIFFPPRGMQGKTEIRLDNFAAPSDFQIHTVDSIIHLHKNVLLRHAPFFSDVLKHDPTNSLDLSTDLIASTCAFPCFLISLYLQEQNLQDIILQSATSGKECWKKLQDDLIREVTWNNKIHSDSEGKVPDGVEKKQDDTKRKQIVSNLYYLQEHLMVSKPVPEPEARSAKKSRKNSDVKLAKVKPKILTQTESLRVLFQWQELAAAYQIPLIDKCLASLWRRFIYSSYNPLSRNLDALECLIHYVFKRDLHQLDIKATDLSLPSERSVARPLMFLCFLLYRAARNTFSSGHRVFLVTHQEDDHDRVLKLIVDTKHYQKRQEEIRKNRDRWTEMQLSLPNSFLTLVAVFRDVDFERMRARLSDCDEDGLLAGYGGSEGVLDNKSLEGDLTEASENFVKEKMEEYDGEFCPIYIDYILLHPEISYRTFDPTFTF